MALLTAKSSTIFIAVGDEMHVYRSVEEIPPVLRRKLQATTRGMNAATILIADKGGRAELVRALQGQPSAIQRQLPQTTSPQPTALPKPDKQLRFGDLRTWLELLLPLAVGASLWFFIESRF